MRFLKAPNRAQLKWRFPNMPPEFRTFFLDDWDDDDVPPRPGFHKK